MHLPVIVALGGVSPAGRSSGERAFQRLVYDRLSSEQQQEVLQSLAAMTGKKPQQERDLLDGTLIRRIMSARISDLENLPSYDTLPPQSIAALELADGAKKLHLKNWQQQQRDGKTLLVPGAGAATLRVNKPYRLPASSAGQMPAGFEPGSYYPSRQHPLSLEITVFGMSDALGDLGMEWDELAHKLPPDRVAVFSGSALSQVDEYGSGGYMVSPLLGERASSRALAMGLGEMSADFINAYVLGSHAITGHYMGACATWLYNLSAACALIRNGQVDVAVVGAAEAQVNRGVIEGFHAASALASDHRLGALQKQQGDKSEELNYRRACRPFADNIGMVVGESAQFAILMSDSFALSLGAEVLGSALSTHIHADGAKYSISSPGSGNYLTVAKALAETAAIVGDATVKEHSVMLAHGTGTPQNRVTESHILSTCAQAFGIPSWPIIGIKSVLGHSMACASGDQAMAALGIVNNGLLPGMPGTLSAADDVYQEHLDIRFAADQRAPAETQVAFLNSKGFGGNNATSALLGREGTLKLMRERHGKAAVEQWQKRSEPVRRARTDYDARCRQGKYDVRYRHGEGVLDGVQGDVVIERDELHLRDHPKPVSLRFTNPFQEDD